MPRDNDHDNASSRGRRDRPSGGKGRSGAKRGPEKKFAKRGFGGKGEGDKRPYRGDREDRPFRRREEGDAPRRDYGDKPRRFKRDDRGGDRPFADRAPRGDGEKRFKRRDDREGDKRAYAPRG